MPTTTVLDALNAALQRAFATDKRVYLLGEDVLDPYGGAFKVVRGISSAYPDRVLTTPISEAGITGLAAGMAMRGLRPVVEIMFGDFITLIADQLINHIAKFRWMYNEQVSVPLVIRTPMGGRRGYGPTHSQTLEKLYLGVPGIRVLAACAYGQPGELLYWSIIESQDPVLFIENKLLYLTKVHSEVDSSDYEIETVNENTSWQDFTPAYRLRIRQTPEPVATLVAYGHMAELAREAVLNLAYQHEVFVELIIPTQLAPFDLKPVLTSLRTTRRLVVAEEGTRSMGWGAELIAQAAEVLGTHIYAVRRVAARDLPVPASGPLETAMLPSVEDIIQATLEIV
jgi:pyruvate/2-oxoglutarate/acetoin dehydrogenase E1 component